MDSVILNRLQIIKKFYTYLENIIEMAELLYQIANRMTDNPNKLYKDI